MTRSPIDEYGIRRKRRAWLLRIADSDGRQYWQVPIPRWWLDMFGWGALRGGLWSRFWEQRRRRKQRVAIGKSLDRVASLHGFTRGFLESDARFRERIMRGIERRP